MPHLFVILCSVKIHREIVCKIIREYRDKENKKREKENHYHQGKNNKRKYAYFRLAIVLLCNILRKFL